MRNLPRIALIAFLAGGVLLFGRWGPAEEGARAQGLAIWRGMEKALVEVPGRPAPLEVRVADDSDERAQGMQHLPATEVRANPIWFRFPEARVTHWHMRNVALALDIAWLDASGRVLAVARMEPGETGYRSPPDVRHALELAAGMAERLGIRPGVSVSPPVTAE
ncbi:DUF192 domain-containing protein [Arhodomonas sp. AD133]|uniref:DUF192 domain-containing protein n=1 Tax=Arhodomonas sp. AD133 TaxID=3415009 RepID=UPI003EBBD178